MGQKSLLICLIVIVKLENQRQFYEIYEYCQLIFGKKLKPLTKFSLYCQTKALSYDPLSPGINPLKSGLQPSGPVSSQSYQTIALIGKIMDAGVKTNRDSVFNSLSLLKIYSGSNDSLLDFAAESGSLFTDEPLLLTSNS